MTTGAVRVFDSVLLAQVNSPGASSAQSATTFAVTVLALAIVPFVLLVGTSFVKISVVLGLLRSAFGAAQVPGNLVVTGLAAILSLHVMAPTLGAVVDAAAPTMQRSLASDLSRADGLDAWRATWDAAAVPVRRFLRANSAERDQRLFLDLARESRARQTAQPTATLGMPSADDLTVLLPAFVVSELTSAFAIGFLLLLPFLVVELVIANVLATLGVNGLSASSVSLPFKLLLFVLADGWYLVARALVLGYR